jgi:Protein of unknown function (DUF3108)
MKRAAVLFAALFMFGVAGDLDPVFSRGETLDYDLEWLHLTGGKARMTVAPQPADATNLRLTSIAKSSSSFSRIYKVRDEIESVVQRSTFSTIRYHKDLREGSHHKNDTTTFANGIATLKGKTYPVATPVFDPLSLVYYMRTQDLSPGRSLHYTVFADKKTYDVIANVTRREEIETPLGKFKTVVVEPQMHGGGLYRDEDSKLTIWYSDDERHLPVRIRSDVKIGSITASLRGVTADVTSIEP